jgi:Fur family ferric uptake transcriptional regulator
MLEIEQFQRNTRQRQVILEELQKLSSHPTAAELYEITRRRLPKISLGTIYRNLDLLVRAGVIQKLQISATEARFDGDSDRHCHVRCVRCGRVDDAHEVRVDQVEHKFRSVRGYKILGHRLELFGLCSECRGERTPSAEDVDVKARARKRAGPEGRRRRSVAHAAARLRRC